MRQPNNKPTIAENVATQQKELNRYARILQKIFFDRYTAGATEVQFERDDIAPTAAALNIKLPKNLGDVLYAFRYRTPLPLSIQETAPEGKDWIIQGHGRSKYRFVLEETFDIVPRPNMAEIKVPDATPGIVDLYTTDDEQALLSRLRYNRLIDIFLGLTCYSLQNHLRTTVPNVGQVETDEIYVGIDKRGQHYVVPVQAKGGSDQHNIVQIKQDFALCAHKFPHLICRAIGAQFMKNNAIALFEFALQDGRLVLREEKHYRLITPADFSGEDWRDYLGSLPKSTE